MIGADRKVWSCLKRKARLSIYRFRSAEQVCLGNTIERVSIRVIPRRRGNRSGGEYARLYISASFYLTVVFGLADFEVEKALDPVGDGREGRGGDEK